MSIVSYLVGAEFTDTVGISKSVQDTMFCSALSDCSGKPDFKYVFDVFTSGNQLTRVKLYPDPVNAYGYFDAGPSVRNEMTYEWFTFSTGESIDPTDIGNYNRPLIHEPNQTGEIAIRYDIRFGEEYISGGAYVSGQYVSGGTLVTLLNEASGQAKAFNYAQPIFNRKNIDIYNFDNKFLTNRPLNTKCKLTDDLLIGIKLQEDSNLYIGFEVNQYYANGSLYSSFNSYNDYPAYTDICNEFYQVNIGPNALNPLLDLGGKQTIGSSISYYEVFLIDMDTNTAITNTFRVYIDCNPRYDSIDLHFMNQWGMFDTARFDLTSRLTMDIERKSFTKKDWINSLDTISYNPRQETKINYGSKMNWTYKLTMNYPTDEEYTWLAELISSPQIYANFTEITDGWLMPVTIKNTNYEYSKNQNNGLKTLEIEVELNQVRRGFLR